MTAAISTALTGINAATRGVEEAARRVASYGEAAAPLNAEAAIPADANLAAAAISMKVYEMSLRANAAVVRMTDEMLGELIDTLG